MARAMTDSGLAAMAPEAATLRCVARTVAEAWSVSKIIRLDERVEEVCGSRGVGGEDVWMQRCENGVVGGCDSRCDENTLDTGRGEGGQRRGGCRGEGLHQPSVGGGEVVDGCCNIQVDHPRREGGVGISREQRRVANEIDERGDSGWVARDVVDGSFPNEAGGGGWIVFPYGFGDVGERG